MTLISFSGLERKIGLGQDSWVKVEVGQKIVMVIIPIRQVSWVM